MRNRFWSRTCTYLLAGLLTLTGLSRARADVTGTISGNVMDSSGASVPGASVTLLNANSGFSRTAKSASDGRYEFLAVPIGEGYSVSVELQGFKHDVHTGIVLRVNQVYRADFKLEIGAVTENVSVSSATAQVETESTQVGDVIGSNKITEMPLNGRSYIDLLALQPGVVPISSGASNNDTPVSGELSAGILSVNGAREDANAYLVNGADVEENRNNGAAIIPNLDSIQEFRVLTDTFDAEYGHFAGGIVNVVTKSGTNQFHGTAFEFLRNDALDARNYFDLPGEKGSLKRNQFGGTLGGPIKKERLFFFGDYQGSREVDGVTSPLVNVPTTSELGGNFSDVAQAGFQPLTGSVRGGSGAHSMNAVLSQGLGYAVTNGEPYWVPGCNTFGDAQSGMCVFPNQTIPQSVWSPAAKGLLQYIPKPIGTNTSNGAATPVFTTSANKETINDDKFGARMDWNIHRLGNVGVYYFWDKSTILNPYPQADIPGFAASTPTRAQNASVRDTLTFGASAVNEAEISFTRFVNGGGTPLGGIGPGTLAKLGFATGGNGIIPDPPNFEGVPSITLGQLGINFGMYKGTFNQTDNTYSVQDTFSKIIGRHTIKFGGQFRLFQINELLTYDENGDIYFYGGETGNDLADLLIGAPDNFYQASPGALDARSRYAGLFIQDSFKALTNLTVNYGLRWDVTQPWSDTQNRLQTFIPGQQSVRFPTAPEGWNFAGDPGVAKSIAPTRYKDFAPRLGIAYSPSVSDGFLGKLFGGPNHTSIRAGFGIYYTAYAQIGNQYELGNSPFAIFYVTPVLNYLATPYEARQGQDPGQRFPYVPATGSAVNWATFQPVGGQQSFLKSNVTPYNEQYNLNIQRQVGRSAVATIAYVGTGGRHLLDQVSGNPGNQALCLQIAAQGGGCGPNGENNIYTVGGTTYNGTRPYSVTSGRLLSQGVLDFTEVPTVPTIGSSSYNAFEASVQKDFGPLRLLGAYTYSKGMDNMSGFINGSSVYLNPYNHSLSEGLSLFNIKHNFVVSYTYDLPLQRLFSSNSGLTRRVAGGWQFSGITRLTSGLPVQIVESGDRSLCNCEEGGEPDYDGQPLHFYNPRKTGGQYFSTANFSQEPLGQFGTARHSFFSGPGLNNTDLALHKITPIVEGTSLEFRAEFFNAFNHTQFENPPGDYNSSTFGVVNTARAPRIGQVALKLTF
jgi:Carboxypeptidase regulatory-like domain/TonB-dependent Receptor Plug Domain